MRADIAQVNSSRQASLRSLSVIIERARRHVGPAAGGGVKTGTRHDIEAARGRRGRSRWSCVVLIQRAMPIRQGSGTCKRSKGTSDTARSRSPLDRYGHVFPQARAALADALVEGTPQDGRAYVDAAVVSNS
jgi:hypothetical protein